MKKTNTDEEVEVISSGTGYYIKPSNSQYQFFHSVKVPKRIWDEYVERRTEFIDVAQDIKTYFKLPKDVPMVIAKNHVMEGETTVAD